MRRGFETGRWGDRLPPIRALAAELSVAPNTLMAAIRRLSNEGQFTGAGRHRRIRARGETVRKKQPSHFVILAETPLQNSWNKTQLLLNDAKHRLEKAGFTVSFAPRAQSELGGDVGKISRMVEETVADAWIVIEGSKSLIEWFSGSGLCFLNWSWRPSTLPIATVATDADIALRDCMKKLLSHGHRRIVMICPRDWRIPEREGPAGIFREELARAGIVAGEYNLPDWDPGAEGFQRLLKSLFILTPPTAVIFYEYELIFAALMFFAERKLRVPDDVSLVSMRHDPALQWCHPPIAHFVADYSRQPRNALKWALSVSKGESPTRNGNIEAVFVPEASIGAAPRGRPVE